MTENTRQTKDNPVNRYNCYFCSQGNEPDQRGVSIEKGKSGLEYVCGIGKNDCSLLLALNKAYKTERIAVFTSGITGSNFAQLGDMEKRLGKIESELLESKRKKFVYKKGD